MRRWEYIGRECRWSSEENQWVLEQANQSFAPTLQVLKVLGEAGWELVTAHTSQLPVAVGVDPSKPHVTWISPATVYLFKREVDDQVSV